MKSPQKALEKKTLATLFAIGLNVARIVIWISLAGLTIAMVLVPLLPMLIDWVTQFDNVHVESDVEIEPGDFVKLARAYVSLGVGLYVIERLLELLRTIRIGTPFVAANALRFRRIGHALLLGEAAKFVFGIAGAAVGSEININLSVTSFIAIASVFVLAEIFAEGARMKEEQDLTV